MIRKIIKIDEGRCDGCGLCAEACHERAIAIIDGKARLIRDDYCDGLGDCLPSCPTNAITFEEREADAYNEEAVKQNIMNIQGDKLPCGCPGTQSKILNQAKPENKAQKINSQLMQWPVQIKLVPINAPYFNNADLLIAADCTAFAYGDFHRDLMQNHVTIIGCPKLDMVDYTEKLTEIIANNNIRSIKVARMEVPCCSGIENAVKKAVQNSGKSLRTEVIVISTDGRIL